MVTRHLALLALLLLLAGCSAGRGCRPEPVAATPTPTLPPAPATWTATATTAATMPAKATRTPSATRTVVAPSPTATETPTAVFTATPGATATPMLLGWHVVAAGQTMFGIGLEWYAGRYLPWGEDVWRPICDANQDSVTNCRLIFVGQRLRIPVR